MTALLFFNLTKGKVKKMAKAITLKQKKIKVLEMLLAAGIKGNSEFLAMSAADMVNSFPDLKTDEFRVICDMQDAVREKKLFSYLCSD